MRRFVMSWLFLNFLGLARGSGNTGGYLLLSGLAGGQNIGDPLISQDPYITLNCLTFDKVGLRCERRKW